MIGTRRQFLQASGALAICFSIPACSERPDRIANGRAFSSNRLIINSSGEVRLMLGKVEFGQGIGTALAQIAAEELNLDFARLQLVAVDTLISPDESYTFSSISVQQAGPPTRRAAAAAKEYLLQRAATQLGTDIANLQVSDGHILAANEKTELSYWNLIGDYEFEIDVRDNQVVKDVADYTVVGKSVPRIDIPAKVFGGASYLQDLRLPDMVHARVVRPVAERAQLQDFDATETERLPGVLKVIRDGNFVAVVARREEQARVAARQLQKSITWELAGDMPNEHELFGWLQSADAKIEAIVEQGSGQPSTDAEIVSGTYQRAYQAHASISPSAAIAQFDGEHLTVWSHAQGMYPLRAGIAHVLGLQIDNIRCLHLEASGCYGHNGADDAACDAAAIAMHFPGKPIRLQWERADEMAWEPYGSAMQLEIKAGLDAAGDVESWNYDIWSCPHSSRPRSPANAGSMIYAQLKEDPLPLPEVQSIAQPNGGADRNGIPLYAFANMNVTKHLLTDVPLRVSALRGLGAYANVYAIESFMDELAEKAGVDPLDYRLRHLQDERGIAVLKQLADMCGWYQRPTETPGEGWGLGFARFKNRSSYVGVAMRVAVAADTGAIRLLQAKAVCDAGLIVNPDGASAQIEGSIVQSASWTLKERVRFSPDKKQSLDWASYPILQFDEIPEVEVAFVARDDQPSLGVGESAQGPTAAAICNAVYAASGKRPHKLPLQAE